MTTPLSHRLDVIGDLCPLPVLKAMSVMRRLEPGDVLELVGDDPGILEDIPSWCDLNGHELLRMVEDLGVVTCWVRKGEGRRPSP